MKRGRTTTRGSQPDRAGQAAGEGEPASGAGDIATGGRGNGWWAAVREYRRAAAAARAARAAARGGGGGSAGSRAVLTDRGYPGRGGGRAAVVTAPPEWRATTTQVAGLWPWTAGASAPVVGVPVGVHYITGAPVHFDPMSWFRAGYLSAPITFIMALNGYGKSSLIRRMVTGAVASGETVLVLGDTKPDYRALVETLGGQVIDLGYGRGQINPLAVGALGEAAIRLRDPLARARVAARAEAGQVMAVAGLIELVRGSRVADYEETLIAAGLRELYSERSGFTADRPPLLEDLLAVIADSARLARFAEEDTAAGYRAATKPLRRSLRALTEGPFGAIFNGHTSTRMDLDAPAVCVDVSGIPDGDTKLLAAVLMVCWSDGFGAVAAAHELADAGLAPPRTFGIVMDEIWRVLGAGDFMVDRVDVLTRLHRAEGAEVYLCSHTMKDLASFNSAAAVNKALGFIERARAKIIGPVGPDEVERLRGVMSITSTEAKLLTDWAAPRPPSDDLLTASDDGLDSGAIAPGTGCFLLKTGEAGQPGIPLRMLFTPTERASGVHDTNQRFHTRPGSGPGGG